MTSPTATTTTGRARVTASTAARTAVRRVRQLRADTDVQARLERLEADVQENRRLQRRVAELTDLVTELVVPLTRVHRAGTDPAVQAELQAEVDEVLARYRSLI